MDWECVACGELSDADFEVCWNCGAGKDGTPPAPGFLEDAAASDASARTLDCLRCSTRMRYGGRKRFHEGARAWPFLFAELGALFVNREAFDVYACPACGKVEMFLAPVDARKPVSSEVST